jgi:predicted DNA-binding transcriptional regulator AlpA
MTEQMQNEIKLFNDIQAGKILGLSEHTLRKMRCQGVGPAYRKLGKNVRYTLSDLQGYIEKSAVSR